LDAKDRRIADGKTMGRMAGVLERFH